MNLRASDPGPRWITTVTRLLVTASAAVLIGLAVDGARLAFDYQLGQATLDGAAAAAGQAVDEAASREAGSVQLRLTASVDGLPTAYDLAQLYVEAEGRGRVAVTDLVFDGQRVIVRGVVASPTVFLRWFGPETLVLELLSTAEVNWTP